MRTRRPSPEHQAAVARRLALLSAELANARPDPTYDDLGDDPPAWTDAHTRVRVGPAPTPEEEREPDLAPLVPTPGRHASRRAGRTIAALVPETLRGRVTLGPAQVAVVCALVTLGLAATCWWVIRGDAAELPAPTLTSAAGLVSPPPGAPRPVSATGTAPEPSGNVTVDVTGKVRHPGIAVLEAGSRVVDALEAAGGARPGVDLSTLNLARVLVDGEQILVGVPAAAGVAAAAAPSAGATGGPLVNLNTASQTELEELPDVGPVTAQAIIAWRTEHGGYTAVDELLEVDGIGDATLSKLAPYVTI
ncbi:MAG: Helix-hairpin-helix repeat-containing competence protein ComEA [Nocardioides sp.]|jgi:competence protein ComEA|nr:Helix-hairpin-helix repeat-containing competence protein ComEA [Nocardioides sp.]